MESQAGSFFMTPGNRGRQRRWQVSQERDLTPSCCRFVMTRPRFGSMIQKFLDAWHEHLVILLRNKLSTANPCRKIRSNIELGLRLGT
jgi:hypothetical protein